MFAGSARVCGQAVKRQRKQAEQSLVLCAVVGRRLACFHVVLLRPRFGPGNPGFGHPCPAPGRHPCRRARVVFAGVHARGGLRPRWLRGSARGLFGLSPHVGPTALGRRESARTSQTAVAGCVQPGRIHAAKCGGIRAAGLSGSRGEVYPVTYWHPKEPAATTASMLFDDRYLRRAEYAAERDRKRIDQALEWLIRRIRAARRRWRRYLARRARARDPWHNP